MNTRPQQQQDVARSGQGRRAGYFFDYDCMKSTRHMADAGSIPATSTTTGVHGFDGMDSLDGQSAMAPAALGSAESGVRCDGPNPQTPMTAFIRLRRQLDDPAARVGTNGRHRWRAPARWHLFNGASAGADRIGERVAVGDGSHGFEALICVATPAGTTRRIKPEISTGRSASFNATDAAMQCAKLRVTNPIGKDKQVARGFLPAHPEASGSRTSFNAAASGIKTGVLEPLPDESNIAATCFKGMGSFRLASQTGEPHIRRPAAPFTQGNNYAGCQLGAGDFLPMISTIGSAAQRGPSSAHWAGRSPFTWAERGRKWITIHS